MPYRKKLIEVALPLDAINKESAREKSIRHGHPSTLHLWWARRPLAACRAVLFAQLVDDPSEYMPDEKSADEERQRLFDLIEELVKWENSNNEEVLDKARLEIARSVARDLGEPVPVGKQAIREFLATKAPPVLDPFAGGGSIPLEAQRLGLRAYASDLNPVAVLINKAMIEIPPKFADMPPVHPPHPKSLPHEGRGGLFPHPLAPSPTRGGGGLSPFSPAPEGGLTQAEYDRLEVPEDLRRKMVEVARQFRKGPTPSEALLWQALRGKKLDGVKFRRQQPIGPFVVDFYAPAHRLVVEVDGPIHEAQIEADRQRQRLLESLGLRVIRLTARQVETDLPGVIQAIRTALLSPPSPLVGEGGRGVEGAQLPLWKKEWKGAKGLAEDVRYYGKWMRDEAEKRIGHLYPKYQITQELLAERPDLKAQGLKPGDELTVIAWLWARTVTCPNPACGAQMPLVRSFALSTKKGKEARVEPLISPSLFMGEGTGVRAIRFTVRTGSGKAFEGTVNRNGARCIACGTAVPLDHVRAEGKAGRMSARMMAIVAEGKNGRVYLPPDSSHEKIAASAKPAWKPDQELHGKCRVSVPLYGMNTFGDLFTPRQLTALTTFSDLVGEARQKALEDARAMGDRDPQAYADAVATYLGMAVSRLSNRMSSLSFWDTGGENTQQVFARQALPMTWDFVEANPLCNSTGSFINGFEYICSNLQQLPAQIGALAIQNDATTSIPVVRNPVISTDPPYYDNIGYADLSDYFYIWLRNSLKNIYSDLFATLLVPKSKELVATPYRFNGDVKKANVFFEAGLKEALAIMEDKCDQNYPVTIFYAYKQSEKNIEGRSSTGWETFVSGVLEAGFKIHGTWPMRTEQPGGLRVIGQNSLASSIVLVCRPRAADAPTATRRDFLAALNRELPPALRRLQQGSIAPVDLAQAAIGPGMAVFSRYARVLEADGSPMRVRTALALINQALDEYLAEQEGEYDADTRWALAWYEQYGFNEGPFGVAETLSKAKNTSVEGLVEAGILFARAGKVRLLRREELGVPHPPTPSPTAGGRGSPGLGVRGTHSSSHVGEGSRVRGEIWDPQKDKRPTAWEAVQHLIRALDTHGEQGAALLLSRLGGLGETARDLAYRLYAICERKGWAQDALGYNMLVVAWPRLKEMARSARWPEQGRFL